MSLLQTISIARIDVPEDRARGLDHAWVEGLAAIIEAEGLIQPIAVKVIGEHINGEPLYKLMAGGHRLAACKALGWETMPATVYDAGFGDADLIETLENLARRELTALDKAKHFARFKAAYEAKHGPIEKGGDRKSGAAKNQSPRDGLWSFHDAISDRTGFKRTIIFDYLGIWYRLAPDSYERISALASVADNKAQLKALSEQTHDVQDQALGLIEAEKAGSVADALDLIAGIHRKSGQDAVIGRAVSAWSRLSQVQRFGLFDNFEADIRAYANQRGWL